MIRSIDESPMKGGDSAGDSCKEMLLEEREGMSAWARAIISVERSAPWILVIRGERAKGIVAGSVPRSSSVVLGEVPW